MIAITNLCTRLFCQFHSISITPTSTVLHSTPSPQSTPLLWWRGSHSLPFSESSSSSWSSAFPEWTLLIYVTAESNHLLSAIQFTTLFSKSNCLAFPQLLQPPPPTATFPECLLFIYIKCTYDSCNPIAISNRISSDSQLLPYSSRSCLSFHY